jgi:hypothetical protein
MLIRTEPWKATLQLAMVPPKELKTAAQFKNSLGIFVTGYH